MAQSQDKRIVSDSQIFYGAAVRRATMNSFGIAETAKAMKWLDPSALGFSLPGIRPAGNFAFM